MGLLRACRQATFQGNRRPSEIRDATNDDFSVTIDDGPPTVSGPTLSTERMEPLRRKAIHDAMVRLADGDRLALQGLIDELWPVILAFARRGLGHAQDAEDVAQEVFLRVCSRISDFDRERDGLSWAFGIASYEIMTHRRRQLRRREVAGAGSDDAPGRHPDPAVSQEEAVMTHELITKLALASGTLSDDDRAALGLVGDPASMPVAAAALRKRRQRALDRLRSVWRRLYGEP